MKLENMTQDELVKAWDTAYQYYQIFRNQIALTNMNAILDEQIRRSGFPNNEKA